MSNNLYSQISLPTLKEYLESAGWTPARRSSHHILYQLCGESDEPLQLFIATSDEIRGWERSVSDAVETLAGLENNSIKETFNNIARWSYDIIDAKLPDALVHNDAISLDVAHSFIYRLKSLLQAAATVEERRSRYYKRVAKSATVYASKCRFAHTFRGSFGFTVESPLPPIDSSLYDRDATIPFERRVVERVWRGFEIIQHEPAHNRVDALVEQYATAWNGNMCEELILLSNVASAEKISFSFDLSGKVNAGSGSIDRRPSDTFAISYENIEVVKRAAEYLKLSQQDHEVELIGDVVELRADRSSEELFLATSGKIVVRSRNTEYGVINVHVTLDETDYLAAVTAHYAGSKVYVHGTLRKEGRRWFIDDGENFRVFQKE